MSEFLFRISRRKFIAAAGASAVGAIALKGCTSAPNSSSASGGAEQTAVSAMDENALYEAAKKEGKLAMYTVFFTQDINQLGLTTV